MSRKGQERQRPAPGKPEPAAAAEALPMAPEPGWVAPAAAAARVLIGLVLLTSGLQKAAAPVEEFAAVISAYDLLPQGSEMFLASLLPGLEILVALSLILGYQSRAAAAAAGGLFAVFIGALASTLAREIPLPDCGCFGNWVHLSPGQALGLDSALLCLSYFAYRKGGAFSPLDSWVEGRSFRASPDSGE